MDTALQKCLETLYDKLPKKVEPDKTDWSGSTLAANALPLTKACYLYGQNESIDC